MTALAPPLRPLFFLVPFTPGATQPFPQAHGHEGQSIEKTAAAAIEHINDRPSRLLAEVSYADPFEYEPIQMDHAFAVKVKYRYAGEWEPLPFPEE